jgi:hypothetical protein
LSEQALDLSRAHAKKVFERHNFEAMTREQLISFAEGAINEARRKGLIEAEGLASRQLRLSRETDLDLMRGVVKEYQSRIAEVEAELKEFEHTKVTTKADTRPLSDQAGGRARGIQGAHLVGAVRLRSRTNAKHSGSGGFIPFDRGPAPSLLRPSPGNRTCSTTMLTSLCPAQLVVPTSWSARVTCTAAPARPGAGTASRPIGGRASTWSSTWVRRPSTNASRRT